jgi:hypothetical protein
MPRHATGTLPVVFRVDDVVFPLVVLRFGPYQGDVDNVEKPDIAPVFVPPFFL